MIFQDYIGLQGLHGAGPRGCGPPAAPGPDHADLPLAGGQGGAPPGPHLPRAQPIPLRQLRHRAGDILQVHHRGPRAH